VVPVRLKFYVRVSTWPHVQQHISSWLGLWGILDPQHVGDAQDFLWGLYGILYSQVIAASGTARVTEAIGLSAAWATQKIAEQSAQWKEQIKPAKPINVPSAVKVCIFICFSAPQPLSTWSLARRICKHFLVLGLLLHQRQTLLLCVSQCAEVVCSALHGTPVCCVSHIFPSQIQTLHARGSSRVGLQQLYAFIAPIAPAALVPPTAAGWTCLSAVCHSRGTSQCLC